MGGLSGEAILIAIVIALTVYIGEETVKGAKWVGHKTKCGVMKVVGKPCVKETK